MSKQKNLLELSLTLGDMEEAMLIKSVPCGFCGMEILLYEDVNFVRKDGLYYHVCDECYNKHIVAEYNRIKEDI